MLDVCFYYWNRLKMKTVTYGQEFLLLTVSYGFNYRESKTDIFGTEISDHTNINEQTLKELQDRFKRNGHGH